MTYVEIIHAEFVEDEKERTKANAALLALYLNRIRDPDLLPESASFLKLQKAFAKSCISVHGSMPSPQVE